MPSKIKKEQFTTWLNTAIPFSIWRWSNKAHVIEARDYISKEIGEQYRNSRDRAKDRDMLLVFLLNLWVGFCTGCPIKISLHSNRYSNNGAYAKVFFTYKRTRRILGVLERRGYLQRANGYFFEEDKKETRIWATEKLIRLFVDYQFKPIGDVDTLKQEKPIQLREEIKKRIKDKNTGRTRTIKHSIPVDCEEAISNLTITKNLEKYNTAIHNHKITLNLQEEDLISTSELIDGILRELVSGSIKLTDSELIFKEPNLSVISDDVEEPVLSVFSNVPGLMITSISYDRFHYPTLHYDKDDPIEIIDIDSLLLSITKTLQGQQWQGIQPETAIFLYLFYIKKVLSILKIKGRNKKERARKRQKLMNEKRSLGEFGIRSLKVEINRKSLHRVFNRASFNFDKGGRFYGGFYQGSSEETRKRILINGNETTELDFSGMHIRMLYHQLGLEFKEDPYTVGDGSLRDGYKLVSLISINAKRQGAHMAVKDALQDAGFEVADDINEVQAMMREFQIRHESIQEYLFSGVGIDLQNKDSQIMEKILMRLLENGICGLPVHDSVIVEKQYAGFLMDVMKEAYEEVMGFEPVLK